MARSACTPRRHLHSPRASNNKTIKSNTKSSHTNHSAGLNNHSQKVTGSKSNKEIHNVIINGRKSQDTSPEVMKTPTRSRNFAEKSLCYDVETEFCRVFSEQNERFSAENDLSFLFRGACNNIVTSTVGMYGEISSGSLRSVCRKMMEFGLDERSVVLDLGSGRGVPNFLFASDSKAFSSIGVEKCPIAYLNSISNVCSSICRDIRKIKSTLEPVSTPQHTLNSIDDDILSVSTQMEDDQLEFSEDSETPYRFLKSPQSPLHSGDKCVEGVVGEDLERGFEEFKVRKPTFPVAFVNEDIIAYDSFEGVTHFYSFDIAMERALINNMVYQFKNTSTAYVFASFISDLITNFDLSNCFLGGKIPCRMFGSGEGKTCYIYVKNDWRKIKSHADEKLRRVFDKPGSGFNVSNYDEPYNSIDAIKLSKMPLYFQYKWYLKRLDKFYRPFVTRSQSSASVLREKLASERDVLIEKIAHANPNDSKSWRRKLKNHIQDYYKITSTFP